MRTGITPRIQKSESEDPEPRRAAAGSLRQQCHGPHHQRHRKHMRTQHHQPVGEIRDQHSAQQRRQQDLRRSSPKRVRRRHKHSEEQQHEQTRRPREGRRKRRGGKQLLHRSPSFDEQMKHQLLVGIVIAPDGEGQREFPIHHLRQRPPAGRDVPERILRRLPPLRNKHCPHRSPVCHGEQHGADQTDPVPLFPHRRPVIPPVFRSSAPDLSGVLPESHRAT